MKIVTCVAPVNIAVIKYWGKRNEELILPFNDSISTTLSLEHMCAKTTVMISPDFEEDKFWLNGKEETLTNPRMQNCLKHIKERVHKDSTILLAWKIHICSENNFPTAAGLASSAAGYACLVSALAALYGIKGDITTIARQGSGSACRSIYGGWVHWHMGAKNDGSDSIATQIVPASFWPNLRILVLVVNDSRKKNSSTAGMQLSVLTSPFLKYRAEKVVPERVQMMLKSIEKRDFETFAKLTMQDSNQFHSVCLDTFPPCVYMNDMSHAIVDLVHTYNNVKGIKVAYTFDAGPNACLYTLESNVNQLITLVNEVFPTTVVSNDYFKGLPFEKENLSHDLMDIAQSRRQNQDVLKYIIHTKIGGGPKILADADKHLLNENGQPKLL